MVVSVQFGSLPFLVLNRVQRKKSEDQIYTTEDPLRSMPYPVEIQMLCRTNYTLRSWVFYVLVELAFLQVTSTTDSLRLLSYELVIQT